MKFRVFLIVLIVNVFFMSQASAQESKKIEGIIKDSTGLTMPGVNITIKGTDKGTVTDIDGKYTLEAKPEDVLIVSFVGFEDQEVKVANQSTINLVLKEGGKALDEVVITGFGEVKKRLYTGSSQSVKMEEIKQDGVADVSQMLQGRAAGVSVQSVSSTFGAAPKITIRGASSINGDGSPLWVIDGVVQEDIIPITSSDLASGDPITLISSSVAGLNPNDILSLEILKDASATAIYGSRSLNGVVVITTKKGAKNQPLTINYSAEITTREMPSYGDKNLLNSKENMVLVRELQEKGLLDVTTLSQRSHSGVFGILARKMDEYDEETKTYAVKNTEESQLNFLRDYELANTDWFKVLFKNSVTQQHTISLSGGGEDVNLYGSLGYYTDPGSTIADNVKRYTMNLKLSYNIYDLMKLSIKALGSYRKQRTAGSDSRSFNSSNGTVSRPFDINPFFYSLYTSRMLRPYDNNGNREYYTRNYAPFNILNEIENNYMDINVQDIKLQVNLDIPIYKDKITYNMVSSLRYVNSERETNRTELSNFAGAYRANDTFTIENRNSLLLTVDPNNNNSIKRVVLPNGGIYINNSNFMENFYLRNSISYSDTFANDHELSIFTGQEIRYIDRESSYWYGVGLDYGSGNIPYPVSDYFVWRLDRNNNPYYGLSDTRTRGVSFFNRITYGYLGKYFFSLTTNFNAGNSQVNEDGSPRWTPTWTTSGKWNIKEETFMKNMNAISQLQGRIAYGLTAAAGNASNDKIILGNSIQNRRESAYSERAIYISSLQNLDITWEKQYEFNVGVDIGFLENRINLNFDAYQRKGFDLFGWVTDPGVGGEYSKYINNADMETIGTEISLQTTNYKTIDFLWSSTINVSVFDQKITNLVQVPTAVDLVRSTGGNIIGYPRNSLFSYKFLGLDNRGQPKIQIPEVLLNNLANLFSDTGTNVPGGLTSYLHYEGPIEPNQSYGFQNTFNYKNISLSVFISGSFGNKIRLPNTSTSNDYKNSDKSIINRWLASGDENITNVPGILDFRITESDNTVDKYQNAYFLSTANVADGGFVRLKNIRLGYQVPKEILSIIKIQSMQLTFQIQNVMLLYADEKLNGVDPEFTNSGGVASSITRQYNFTLNVRL